MFKKKIKKTKKSKSKNNDSNSEQIIKLDKDDVALVLRANGKCETICTLKGKHTLSPQEELIIGLGGLMQQSIFVNSVRDHFMTSMQKMLSAKMMDTISEDVD